MPETSDVCDSEAELSAHRSVKLYKISDASGSLKIEEVSGMPLTQDMLDPHVRNLPAEMHPTLFSYKTTLFCLKILITIYGTIVNNIFHNCQFLLLVRSSFGNFKLYCN